MLTSGTFRVFDDIYTADADLNYRYFAAVTDRWEILPVSVSNCPSASVIKYHRCSGYLFT